jgi:hypothetical protein
MYLEQFNDDHCQSYAILYLLWELEASDSPLHHH